MNVLIISISARWEDRLRGLLARRGHVFAIVDDPREIDTTLEQADYSLAFVGVGETIEEAIKICRRLRAGSHTKPLQILACGALHSPDKIQALLSAGVNDCLTDSDNVADCELRLTLAEFRASGSSDSAANPRPDIPHGNSGISFDGTFKGYFRSSLEGKFIEIDQNLVEMLGYESREELMQIDLSRDLYVDPSTRSRLLTELSTEYKTHEVFCKRRDGTLIALRINWRRVFDDAGNFLYFEGMTQNIPESAKDPKLLRIQYDLALKLSNTFDLQSTLNEVLKAVVQIDGVDCGGIYLFNDSSQNFEIAASLGLPEWLTQALPRYSLDAPQTQYIMQGQPLYLTVGEVRITNRPFFERAGIKCGVIAPIVHQGQVIATLNLGSHAHEHVLLGTRRAVEAIAKQIGGSLARAKIETARQISQQNLQSLLDSLKDMIFVLDETGSLLYSNPMVGRRLGYTREELLNKTVGDLHPPQRRQEAIKIFSQIVSGETSLCEVPLLAKDGGQIPVETILARGKWGKTNAIFGVARDLTERHRARLALHESESRFRAIFDSAAIGLSLSDLHGTSMEVNGALAEMLGYTPAEFIGKSYTEFTHPDDIESVKACMGELLSGKRGRLLFEKRYIHKNGGIVWGRLNASLLRDTAGIPHYIIAIVENITEQKNAEDRLRKNESLLRVLFENLPDFVILVDQNVKIVYANHDSPNLKKEEMIGVDGFTLINIAYHLQCREVFAKVLSTHKVQRGEFLDIFSHFWSGAVVPIVDHGDVQQIMVICTDITEQKRAAEAIEKEQQLLRSIIDLHERDRQITAYEIHDGVAQQVTAALFHLEAFRRLRDSDITAADKSLEISLKLMGQSIDETRHLISGLRPLILDEYGIIEAIEYLIYEHKERSDMSIDFHHDVHFKRLVPPLESAVFRIVQEAVANACRHSKSEVVLVELVERGDRLHIKIRDQGVGFDPKAIDEARFGLRSIRERARLLGGRAEIDSAPGSGACITVELPLVLQVEEQTEL